MNSLVRRIFLLLLFGHQIDGVNRELEEDGSSEDMLVSEPLSFESMKILRYHDKMLLKEELQSTNDEDFITASLLRRKRSTTSICSPHDSCINRCGTEPRDLPYTCNCDYQCVQYSDCCFDYEQQCKHKPNNTLTDNRLVSIPRLSCEILFMKYNLLIVNECLQNYGNDRVKKMCSIKLPKDYSFSDDIKVSDAANVSADCYNSVYKICFAKMERICNVKIEPQCSSAMTRECTKIAGSKCQKCSKSFWPVAGDNKIVYRNSFCALCNNQRKYTVLSPHDLTTLSKDNKFADNKNSASLLTRPCVPVDVDSCPEMENSPELQKLCHSYSGAVLSDSQQKTVYKNRHCAKCHGEDIENLKCATKTSLVKKILVPLLNKFIVGDDQGLQFDDIPAAFSILLNFGLDGQERMYFSSEGEKEMKRLQERCGEGKIWDPFSEVCRQLYCSTEFVLVDYKCVRKEMANEASPSGNETSTIPDARSDFVHLTLTAEVEVIDILQFNGQDIESICENIRESLANSFGINANRIKNVFFNISLGEFSGLNETLRFLEDMTEHHPIAFKIDFDLYEDRVVNASEPSVDSIVSMLASSLSMNGFEFDINNITSRIFEIHQTVSPLTTWCSPESGGRKREYWNSEFSLIMNEDNSTSRRSPIKGIFVNKTGKFYSHGNFVADILFQGYQFSNSLINVSGVAVVCDRENMLNESCIRILVEENEYSVLENGSLYIHNESLRNVVDNSSYEIAENNSILVCVQDLKTIVYFERYRIRMDVVQSMVSLVLLWVSVIALAFVLMTYSAFESLRNLPGCNTMNLTFSLMMMQITFLFGLRGKVTGTPCVVVGHIFHYQILCCFMWMNVMAFDLFRTFGNKNILSNIRSKRKYLPLYSIYAYVSPITVITISSLLDYYAYGSNFAPHYGRDNVCWITNQLAAIVFFAVPLAVIMLVNFVFFLLTIFAMRSVKSLSHLKDHQTNRRGKNDVVLYARMALVIGLTWALSFAAASVRQTDLAGRVLTYLFIICNTLQGVFIFWVFVCNKRVFELYKEALRSAQRKIYKRAKYESSSETISRLAYAVRRSVSNNTVVSTISNASASSNEVEMPAVLK